MALTTPECLTTEAALVRIERLKPTLIAIDGLPCAGKSTLAERLEQRLHAQCVPLDDFLLPPRDWPSRSNPAFPFEYMRYDAFLNAVKSLATNGACAYEPFDWNRLEISHELRHVTLTTPVIVEGVSALHPILSDLYDVRVFVDSDPESTLQTAIERGGEAWEREWREVFLPSVEIYMRTKPHERADLLVAGRGL
jgi:uridine kinase